MSRLGPSEEIKASPEFQALHGYVSGHVSSLGSAQDKFCQSVEDKFMNTENPSDVEESLWRAWRAVTGVAAQTPFDSEQNHKLVTMVVNLQTRPKLEKNGNTCQISDAVVWKDLPLFGMQMRESWNFRMSSARWQDPCRDTDTRSKCLKMTAQRRQSSIG